MTARPSAPNAFIWRPALLLAGIVALPLVLLGWLLAHPRQNLELLVPLEHLVIVANVSLLALAVAVLLARSAGNVRHNYPVLCVALGFMSMAALFSVHAFTTPGVILHGSLEDYGGTVIGLSAYLSLLVPAGLFAARYLPPPLLLFQRGGGHVSVDRLFAPVVVMLSVYAALAFLAPTVLAALPLSSPPGAYIVAALTIVLLGFSAWRQAHVFLASRLPMQGALVIAYLLLIDAQCSMVLAPVWTLAWWEYHVLMLIAVMLALWALFIELDRRRDLERFLASPVVERVLSGSALGLVGERRVVTILFADIRGFTSLSERLAPEEVAQLLNEYFTAMTAEIFREDGILDKYIGDGLMAVFGIPVEYPDHPARALRAALAMQQRMQALREGWRARGSPLIAIGIGVATGHAVVGSIGSPARMEYTAIGSTVNIASRLVDQAGPDQILTTRKTYWRVEHLMEGMLRGPVSVKGVSQPVDIVEIVGQRSGAAPSGPPPDPPFSRAIARVLACSGAWTQHGWEGAAGLDGLDPDELLLARRSALLAALPSFAAIPLHETVRLAASSEVRRAEPGAIIIQQGAAEDGFYVLLEGEAAVVALDVTGNEREVARLGRGAYLGEIAFFFDTPRTATVRAASACRLMAVPRDGFYEVLRNTPVLRSHIEAVAAGRLREPPPAQPAPRGRSGSEEVTKWK